MTRLSLIALLLTSQALAWPVKPKLPDATPDQCKAEGKTFVKRMTRKNGVQVRAHCRAKPKGGKS